MNIRQNVTLAPYTTFGIGGPADYFIEAHSIEEIIEAVQWAREKDLPFFLLGTGANILVGDKGFRGLAIKNEAKKQEVNQGVAKVSSFAKAPDDKSGLPDEASAKLGDDRQDPKILLTVESGATIEELIQFTQEKELSGFEHFAGIPSSVGGALWQNLHFLSPDRSQTVFIGDLVKSATVLKTQNTQSISISESQIVRNSGSPSFPSILKVDKDYFNFSYDYSILHDNHDIVLSATFALTPEDPNIIQERINANLAWRAEKHPKNATKTSAGSIFKKVRLAPSEGGGYGAGRLIEQVGLKGKMIGGAKISEQHANFILNDNNATAKDVRDLIDLVKKTVKEQLGLDMQTEISFIGEF